MEERSCMVAFMGQNNGDCGLLTDFQKAVIINACWKFITSNFPGSSVYKINIDVKNKWVEIFDVGLFSTKVNFADLDEDLSCF